MVTIARPPSGAGTTTAGGDTVIDVRNLHVEFHTSLGTVRAVNGVSLGVPRGKTLGVVGESGCGKSVTAFAIMQLVATPGVITQGEVVLHARGKDSVNLLTYAKGSDDMRAVRGRHIGMIFQEPMTALNPCYTIGNQIAEAILLHRTKDHAQADAMTLEILSRVGLPSPSRLMTTFPHQLSGGMRQRAMIALALSCEPDLLLADEPTTALDVTTQAQILDVMRELQEHIGMSIMFVTHNLGVVAQMCDEVAVMYLGRIVEQASVDELFDSPKHPYTRALMRSIPQLGSGRKGRLEVIQGSIPGQFSKLAGCQFHPRCPDAMPGICDVKSPSLLPSGDGAQVSCFLHHDPSGSPRSPEAVVAHAQSATGAGGATVSSPN
ncbi:MAG: ABC transporter ATP-binding protein [Chloroflexi bacterium]|nr:ABC transporter ATP-binding protein [Chloroflexota bacterium]